MTERRKDLLIVASTLLGIAALLWLLSMQLDPDNMSPNRLRVSSLQELDRRGILSVIVRSTAYAVGTLALVCLAGLLRLPRPAHTGARATLTQTHRTLVAVAVSSILCGLTYVAGPLSFAPGLVFGFFFARVNFSVPRSVGLYALASGIVFVVAASVFQSFSPGVWFGQYLTLGLGGAIGGLGLSVLTSRVGGMPITLTDAGGAAILGAVVALPFVMSYHIAYYIPFVGLTPAFACWQIPMAWYLSERVQRSVLPGQATPGARLP